LIKIEVPDYTWEDSDLTDGKIRAID